MYDINVKNFIEPLTGKYLNKKDKKIVENLKITLKDYLYFKCLSKLYPNYIDYIFILVITSLNYKKYKPHDILLNYNDLVDKVYFIINGKVNIYKISIPEIEIILASICKKHKDVDKGKQILEYFSTYTKKYLNAISEKNIFLNKNKKRRISFANLLSNKKKAKILELESFYRVVINNNKILDFSFEEGKVFGEEYIYNDIKYSNCILECDSDCIIGELDRDDYEKIFKRVNIMERSKITAFLVNLKIFNSSNFFLPKLQRCLIKRNFAKNEIIIKQDDPFRTFYIIRQGKVDISLKIQKKVNCKLEPEIIVGNQKNKRFTSNNAFIIKGEYLEKNEYNLMTFQDGEFIGEIEYYKKLDKYLYTAKCVEDCIVFEIDLFLFEHLIKNNKSINMNLKGFFEKIKEKMEMLQERIFTSKQNNSAIKKSDYVLSKNKFTRNFLQNNPLKENEIKKRLNTSLNKKYKKIRESEDFYINVLSPFLKRNCSANRNKYFKKIEYNSEFFNSKNNSKEEKNFHSNSTSRTRNKSKERNITSANLDSKLSKSKFLLDNNNIYNKLFSSKEKNFKNNYIGEKLNNKSKIRNKTQKNYILNNYINFNKKLKINSNTKNIIFNNINKRNLNTKIKKLYISNNYINTNNIDKSFDFMDPNLDCTGNDRIKNIPIILRETKNSRRYQNIYSKEKIKKINSFYFESPKNTRFNKILDKKK